MKKLREFVKNSRYNYLALRYLIKQEINYKTDLSIWKKFWCLSHGFTSEKYALYDLDENDYKLYLSDFQRHKTSQINGAYSLIINDKNLFTKVFQSEDINAQIYGTIKNGEILLDKEEKTIKEFKSFLISKEKIIIKKHQCDGGKGIYRLSYSKDHVLLNDELIELDELSKFIKTLKHHLIVEHLSQAEYSNEIYSGTINSIRIITMRDRETDHVFIPIAVHKFGSEKTKPVDNVWKGGMT